MALLAVIVPLVIVLSAVLGVAIGLGLVNLVRAPSQALERERRQQLAKSTARKAVDEAVRRIFSEDR